MGLLNYGELRFLTPHYRLPKSATIKKADS
jgi:hypothetical protein